MKTTQLLLAGILAIAFPAAQAAAAADELTPLIYEASSSDAVPSILPGACIVNVLSVSDQRSAKESIGADSPIPAGPPESWIKASLDALHAYGFKVEHSASALPGAVNLDVKLLRAYSWYTEMRINGMVALDVSSATPAGAKTEKFRASGSKTNMWGAKSEHVTALNYAMNNVISRMAPALNAQCAQLKVAALAQ